MIEYIVGSEELLDYVAPLWGKLNELHKNNSKDFKLKYSNMNFEVRREAFLKKSSTGKLRIELAKHKEQDVYIGYCVSSIDKAGNGEIDSIYINPEFRGEHIGDSFMRNALAWMDTHEVLSKSIGVAAGNEQAFGFYRKYGFYPSATILRQP